MEDEDQGEDHRNASDVVMMLRRNLYIPCAILGGVWVFHIVYFIWGVKAYQQTAPA